jgi:hypothetical protein
MKGTTQMNPAENPADAKQIIQVLIQHWPIFLFGVKPQQGDRHRPGEQTPRQPFASPEAKSRR